MRALDLSPLEEVQGVLDGPADEREVSNSQAPAHLSEWMPNGDEGRGMECGRALPWSLPLPVQEQLPLAIRQAGASASYAYVEFFAATIRNTNTRRAYAIAIKQFLSWCEGHHLPLRELNSVLVASYIEQMAGSPPKRKQHLAAIRHFFDHLVLRHVLGFNPASSVRGPRYSVRQGKTPVLDGNQARHLLDSIDTGHILGVRDRALIGLMVYTFARIGAVVTMNRGDYFAVGKRWWVRLHEKGGKEHQVPVHHEAEELLDAYLEASGSLLLPSSAPLFRTLRGRTQVLSPNRLSGNDALCMVKRRARAAGLPTSIGCHTFRATGITAYLNNGGTLEKAQQIANHASPQTTKLYDRTGDDITFDEIQRIRLG